MANELTRHQSYLNRDRGIVVTEVDADEVQRALVAYRFHALSRAHQIVIRRITELLDCGGCLAEYLKPEDDEDQIKDQLRELCGRLQLGG